MRVCACVCVRACETMSEYVTYEVTLEELDVFTESMRGEYVEMLCKYFCLDTESKNEDSLQGCYMRCADLLCDGGKENEVLASMAGTAAAWGYRGGDKGKHVRYENYMHEKGLFLGMQLTDTLFRNMQQVGAGMVLHPCDTIDKLYGALANHTFMMNSAPGDIQRTRAVWLHFFQTHPLALIHVLVMSVLDSPEGRLSDMFMSIVLGARLILCILVDDHLEINRAKDAIQIFIDELEDESDEEKTL